MLICTRTNRVEWGGPSTASLRFPRSRTGIKSQKYFSARMISSLCNWGGSVDVFVSLREPSVNVHAALCLIKQTIIKN